MRHQPLILLELNEVNFDFVRRYVARGQLPALAQMIARHGLAETVSEDKYEELEPWIQWVSAHTGLTFAEHKVFRLGDIVQHEHEQIWEKLEAGGPQRCYKESHQEDHAFVKTGHD